MQQKACAFLKLQRRMTMVHSLSFQNNSCLYPAGKRRKELGVLNSSRGLAKRMKSWQFHNAVLIHTCSHSPVDYLFLKQHQLGGREGEKCGGVTWTDKMKCWFQTICTEFSLRNWKNSHWAHLVSVPQNKASFAHNTWCSTCMWFNFTFLQLSSYIPQKACLIHLTATKWSGQTPALLLSQWHVNGQPHHRCDRGAKQKVYHAFPPQISQATAQASALSGAGSPCLSSLPKASWEQWFLFVTSCCFPKKAKIALTVEE